ncbi:NUDIX domain-containing protein [Paenibacillus apiarius]|uniref:NUDIX domain-containing protein n=1 Tax=Paenibacillus apiarius TaxID=46240 RepID=A0ABT4DRL1_9BACL|nr:NUDIX domain-containing protein [Paenibacillus apiarius]MCY9514681.1 NUDIX domain-containing protein [Paenibacillus apiarius]MCY9518671.1 NUDIX domain-containing protein [Paenibacillus apiarius]MCY9552888.1 NUDIX domain-containing protein [Paenibacillus apiarius]MCY9556913.1 NUDIX domain-containing protein [Paenibacillus apiarius]MCY9686134.1 NUDIX domain-containing protein [Paenibacillus apiarius]
MKPIRNSAKAVIIQDNKVLLTKNQDRDGYFYLFPGGGQEHGEELSEALRRECIEEIGCAVIVDHLLHVREYIGKNHQFAEWDMPIHQVEFYFQCELEQIPASFEGSGPDENQVGVEWIRLQELEQIRVYPHKLVPILQQRVQAPCYLGDTN